MNFTKELMLETAKKLGMAETSDLIRLAVRLDELVNRKSKSYQDLTRKIQEEAALRMLAHLAARMVGPSAFYFPEGANPNRVDLNDDEAALALSAKLTQASGVLTVAYNCQGDWEERRRLQRRKTL